MLEAYTGTIILWAGMYAPRGWLFCNGQQLPLNVPQNQTLFTVIGSRYGGDGKTYFNLPNLNGRVPIGADMGGNKDNGISSYPSGSIGGTEYTALTISNLPKHNHTFNSKGSALKNANAHVSIPVVNNDSVSNIPDNTSILGRGISNSRDANIYSKSNSNATLKPFDAHVTGDVVVEGTIGEAGNGVPFDQRQPYLALNYIICVEGIYPPRGDDW
ncbi:phage tail protein [Lysinibacillus piscis]|uniref:Tail Collar domain-containing protein n=1 Tax=Lysinibacillus piscis TaxID=2518931 RepID=A0ABQ5NQ79_9BACI|nr:tail fiber protein [Lysinibacillus sp. KH24]GLC90169.1 tail Collar domain-containing protein [Lysinibacillus sp. KH24]